MLLTENRPLLLFLYDTYVLSQYVTLGKAITCAFDGIIWQTAGKVSMTVGLLSSATQVIQMGIAIFTPPNCADSKWILY